MARMPNEVGFRHTAKAAETKVPFERDQLRYVVSRESTCALHCLHAGFPDEDILFRCGSMMMWKDPAASMTQGFRARLQLCERVCVCVCVSACMKVHRTCVQAHVVCLAMVHLDTRTDASTYPAHTNMI